MIIGWVNREKPMYVSTVPLPDEIPNFVAMT